LSHQAFRELAAGAALEDLEAPEADELADHLATCAPCRRDAEELVDVAGLVALAAPARRPPATLKRGVLTAVANAGSPAPAARVRTIGEPIDLAATAAATRESASARASAFRWRTAGIVALAAVISMAVTTGAMIVENRSLDSRLATTSEQRDAAVARLATSAAAMSVVLAPDHATVALHPKALAPGAVAFVVYRPGTSDAWLMATGLPAPPAGSVYQLWAADAAGLRAGPTFTCDATGPCLASFGMDLRGMTAAMVTLETAGGPAESPGPEVVFGEL
jgi:hypothetical protein